MVSRVLLNLAIIVALARAAVADPCSPTGPGVCNLGMTGYYNQGTGYRDVWTSITIFDRACNVIGGVQNGGGFGSSPFSISSQLPYTVDIKQLPTNGANTLVFRYAAGEYSNAACTATMIAPHTDAYNIVCQKAFNC